MVHAFHPGCGRGCTVRLPAALPAGIVRRVRCEHCSERFERDPELDAAPPELREAGGPGRGERLRGGWASLSGSLGAPEWLHGLDLSESRAWSWLALPLAAAAVVVAVMLISGSDGEPGGSRAADGSILADPDQARLIERPAFSLALPAGWKRAPRPNGAAFAAVSADGEADATLWISENPDLSFKRFERRSLNQIEAIAGSAEVSSRVDGPTRETSIVEIRGGAPDPSSPDYRVTLRAAGDYFHYLATSIEPGASPKLSGDAEILHTSLLPSIPAE